MRTYVYNIVESKNKIGFIYSKLMVMIIFFSLLPLMIKSENEITYFIDKITVTLFILDYLLRWLTADLRYCNKSPKSSFLFYPLTPMAIIDLISILPSVTLLNESLKALRIFRLIRTFKVFRVLKFARYSKNLIRIKNVFVKQKQALIIVVMLALFYIFVSALIIFNIEPESFNSFFDAIYWAVVSLTTVGYGDIYPVTTIGKVVTMISAILGIAIVALPAGIITAGYMEELEEEKDNK